MQKASKFEYILVATIFMGWCAFSFYFGYTL